jgi:hypothetical protein
LDSDDRLGARQAQRQPCVILFQWLL